MLKRLAISAVTLSAATVVDEDDDYDQYVVFDVPSNPSTPVTTESKALPMLLEQLFLRLEEVRRPDTPPQDLRIPRSFALPNFLNADISADGRRIVPRTSKIGKV